MVIRVHWLSGLVLLAAALLFLGCSEDPFGKKEGDYGDAAYLTMKSRVEDDLGDLIQTVSFGSKNFDGFDTAFSDGAGMGGLAKRAVGNSPQDTAYYEYQNGWHIYIVNADSAADSEQGSFSARISLADSVQFRREGVVVVEPDENTDFLQFKVWAELHMEMESDSLGMSIDIDRYHINNRYQKLADGNIEANGAIELEYGMDMVLDTFNISGEIDYNMDIKELVIESQNGCPQSGQLSANITENFTARSGNGLTSWKLTITFLNPSAAKIRIESGDNFWEHTYDYECNANFAHSLFMPKSPL